MKFIIVLISLVAGVAAQPVNCHSDWQCSGGYCMEATATCQECIRCDDLNRGPPSTAIKCIKSITDCGACIEGFVERQRDLVLGCEVPGASPSDSTPLSPVMWTIIVVAVLLFVLLLIGVFVVFVRYLRVPLKFNIDSQVHTVTNDGAEGAIPPIAREASAPDYPPSYEAAVETRAPTELNANHYPYNPFIPINSLEHDTELQPFITSQRSKSQRESPPLPRQSDENQAASVFNPPVYVRGPNLPSSDEGVPYEVHDETTVESTWTPNETNDNEVSDNATNNNTVAVPPLEMSSALASARQTTLVRAPPRPAPAAGPPAKQPRRSSVHDAQDNNNKGEGGAPAAAASFRFNVQVNNNFNVDANNLSVSVAPQAPRPDSS